MRVLIALVMALFVFAAPSVAAAKKQQTKAFGFVTMWSGKGGKLFFDVRFRTDGKTVVRYSGYRLKGKTRLPVKGTIAGKVTATNRTLKSGKNRFTVPRLTPVSYDESGPGIVHVPAGWGHGRDGLDFSIGTKGFDVPLAGFDVPLAGFVVPDGKKFDEPILFHEVAVDQLGGGLAGIAVAISKGGKTTLNYAVKTGGRKLLRGALGGSSKKKISLSRSGASFSGTARLPRKAQTISGQLRVKVGDQWKSSRVSFQAPR